MARAVTLSELIERTRRMADMENSLFVSDAEVTDYINHAIAELYDVLVSNYGEEWGVYQIPAEIAVTASVDNYNLPDSFYKLRAVDKKVGSEWEPINKARFIDRFYDNSSTFNATGGESYGYRLFGGTTIKLIPTPTQAGTIRLWYIPAVGNLVNGTDQLDGVNGYEEYVVVDAAIKCLLKEETDVTFLEMRKQQLLRRIEVMSDERDVGQPDTIRDVRGGWWFRGSGPWG